MFKTRLKIKNSQKNYQLTNAVNVLPFLVQYVTCKFDNRSIHSIDIKILTTQNGSAERKFNMTSCSCTFIRRNLYNGNSNNMIVIFYNFIKVSHTHRNFRVYQVPI